MRKRLDVLLVERGLAESRAQAQALVMAGLVHGYEKAGQQGPYFAGIWSGWPSLQPDGRPIVTPPPDGGRCKENND